MRHRIHETLLEQMQISEAEIALRKELLGLNEDAFITLSNKRYIIEANVDSIVDEFYNIQTAIDEIALLIRDGDTFRRLRNAQRKYIIDLFSGDYNSEYVNNRLRIGMVHKRIGVEPKLYLSAVKTLKKLLKDVLKKNIDDSDELENTLNILDDLFYFDTTLIFDTYIDSLISEIQSAKAKTEAYAKSLELKVAERTKQLEDMAKIDPVTNTYNRRAMKEIFIRELMVTKRRETELSLVIIDVDKFKLINDRHGHVKGDEVLSTIGNIIRNCIREMDVPCRYGGDEFCLILPECDADSARNVCERIILKFTEVYKEFSLSIGIATTGPDDYLESDELFILADKHMYESKKFEGSHITCKLAA